MTLLAQAILEKAALDSLVSGVSASFGSVVVAVQDRPWLWVVLGVALLWLLRRNKS